MKEVDELIEALAKSIKKTILSGKTSSESEVAEKTKALAELISARAKCN